jgi:hypothetical protein
MNCEHGDCGSCDWCYQAKGRLKRAKLYPWQKRAITFLNTKTVDERVEEMLANKKKLLEAGDS